MTIAAAADLLEVATTAARLAGEHAARAFHTRIAAREKSSFHDLVTALDRETEEIIVAEITRRCPDSTIVAEEGGVRGDGELHWYVDPIDGTNNFARGLPFFCVSIGAALGDALKVGVIYEPIRDEMFTASERGAFLNGVPIRSGGVTSDAAALLVTDFPHPARAHRGRDYELYADLIGAFGTVRRLGSCALGLAYVAAGRVDVTVATNANAWDAAAGGLLVVRAGGQLAGPVAGAAPWRGPVVVAACPEFELARSSVATFLATPEA
jgi:myo-inositol-1(or 4)-monophosphatase